MVLKGILKDSKRHYSEVRKKIKRKIDSLPKGSIKRRYISGHYYYYLQHRVGTKVVHKYLGKKKPEAIINGLKQRKRLQMELKKADEALQMIRRAERKPRKKNG